MNHPSPEPETRVPSPVFVLVAGEASGDLLGADLIAGLKQRFANARFTGIGGPRMRDAGMELWCSADKLSVMGLAEVFKHLPALLALRRDVYKRTLMERPDVFIGIDAPDFNLGLEHKLRRAGVRTVHYVSPSVWAWRERRAAKIGRSADRVLCLFPMEPPIYARYGVDARFVGHPLADVFPIEPDTAAARRALNLPADALVLALLPGSRLDEIARLAAVFLTAAQLLRMEFPQLHIVAPMANASCLDAFAHLLRSTGLAAQSPEKQNPASPESTAFDSITYGNIRILSAESRLPISGSRLSLSHEVMIAADAVLLASGTAALEAMLAKRAMVVAYRVAPLTYRLVKTFGLLRTEFYSLPNILTGKRLVPELMQDACTPPALAAALAPMLHARKLSADILQEFIHVHESLRSDAEHGAAASVDEFVCMTR